MATILLIVNYKKWANVAAKYAQVSMLLGRTEMDVTKVVINNKKKNTE